LTVVRTTTMQPATTDKLTLIAIAAAVVGGCSLTGGRGTVLGMIIGAALIRTVENAYQSLLAHLATLTRNTCHITGTPDHASFDKLAELTPTQRRVFKLLDAKPPIRLT
jgi:ABC-type branched-subunit amino acid transport system permease subunit